MADKKSSKKLKQSAKKSTKVSKQSQKLQSATAANPVSELENARKSVLKKGGRLRYPLQQANSTIVRNSVIIFLVGVVLLFGVYAVSIFGYRSTGPIVYEVSSVVPTPMGKVNNRYIWYNDYLSIYRSQEHFLVTQKGAEPGTNEFKSEAKKLKQESQNRVIDNSIAQKIASDKGIKVSEKEIDQQVFVLETQSNGGKSNDGKLNDVLQEWYDWDRDDLRKEVRSQLLKHKLPPLIDTATQQKGKNLLEQVQGGADFAELAKQNSEEPATAEKGGDTGLVEPDSTLYPVEFTRALYLLQEGEVAPLVTTPDGIFLIKATGEKEGVKQASTIFLAYQDPNTLLEQLRKKADITLYVPEL
jgi:parvulin-like peptidyl-prolyl isomerase